LEKETVGSPAFPTRGIHSSRLAANQSIFQMKRETRVPRTKKKKKQSRTGKKKRSKKGKGGGGMGLLENENSV